MVLWTRLAPQPLVPGGGMAPDIVPMRWEVARDSAFRSIAATRHLPRHARLGALGTCRAQGAGAGPGLLVPLPRGRRHQSHRPHPHRLCRSRPAATSTHGGRLIPVSCSPCHRRGTGLSTPGAHAPAPSCRITGPQLGNGAGGGLSYHGFLRGGGRSSRTPAHLDRGRHPNPCRICRPRTLPGPAAASCQGCWIPGCFGQPGRMLCVGLAVSSTRDLRLRRPNGAGTGS